MEAPSANNYAPPSRGCQPRRREASGERPEAAAGASSLPCLSRNNCIEKAEKEAKKPKLSGHQKKVAEALKFNTTKLVEKHGVENVAFVTFTLEEDIKNSEELSKRWHSVRTNVISDRYVEWVRVFEQQKSGRWHVHCVVVIGEDVRTGFDWDAFDKACYWYEEARLAKRTKEPGRYPKCRKMARKFTSVYANSAAQRLRDEWEFWRATAKKYGFGRTEVLPVKSSEEAIGKYLGKYIGKSVGNRNAASFGVRLVATSKEARKATAGWSWNSPGSYLWRKKLAAWAQSMGFKSMDRIKDELGSGWVWKWADTIMAFDLATLPGGFTYPSGHYARRDGRIVPDDKLDLPFHVERKVQKFDKAKHDHEREQRIDLDELWNPDRTCQTEREAIERLIPRAPNDREKQMREFARSMEPYSREISDVRKWLREFDVDPPRPDPPCRQQSRRRDIKDDGATLAAPDALPLW